MCASGTLVLKSDFEGIFDFEGTEGDDTVGLRKLHEVYDRALQSMMNGELHSKGAKNMIWILEKPAWMHQNPSEWTSEQKQFATQFQTEQKRIDELRDTRRQAVEAEVHIPSSKLEAHILWSLLYQCIHTGRKY